MRWTTAMSVLCCPPTTHIWICLYHIGFGGKRRLSESECVTKTTDRNAKKPVMVWFHGGGYAAGSSIEMVAYDGVNLVEYGDVVVVTVNHRLNIFGYFDLSSYDEKYWNSGNAGNADLVASLQWVHDNIEAFGGDPDNVTIFGQSGGGGKVINMYMTPAADKLFARGIMMSGGAGAPRNTERHDREIAEMLMKRLDVKSVEELEAVPTEDLIYAFRQIDPELKEKGLEWNWLVASCSKRLAFGASL